MIVYEKTVNTSNGSMSAKTALIGQSYPIPTKGNLILKSIEEGLGNNKKPMILLKYEKGITVELPDFGVEKLRDGN